MPLDAGTLTEICSGRRWSPLELWRQIAARAARNRQLGLEPGDRVLLLADNTLEFFAELLAVWESAATAFPVDSSLSALEFETLLRAADPRLAVRTGPAPGRWPAGSPLVDGANFEPPSSEPESAPCRRRLDDDALVLFTSGSTGVPKGVVHTHRSLLAQWTKLRQSLGVEAYRRTLCLLPVYFGHGLICNALFPLLSGCDLYLGPAFAPSVLAGLGRLIDEHRITAMSSVPSLWRLALRLSGEPRQGTLERVHCGSAPLAADLWRQIGDWTPRARVVNTYGITETASWLGGSLAEAPADGLIGKPWGGDFRVLHSPEMPEGPLSEAECAPGQTGYVWVRTPALMRGYYQRDDLTRAVVRDGWFYTGDVGFRDTEGSLFLSGRAVDEINKGGLKIQPQDVEIVAAACPHVVDVCVFPVPDDLYGQNVAIAVAMEPGGPERWTVLAEWMRERLSRHKVPSAWYALEAMPRTARGKIHRPTVAALCAGLQPLDPRSLQP